GQVRRGAAGRRPHARAPFEPGALPPSRHGMSPVSTRARRRQNESRDVPLDRRCPVACKLGWHKSLTLLSMDPQSHTVTVSTRGRGLHDITREVSDFVARLKVAAPGPRT